MPLLLPPLLLPLPPLLLPLLSCCGCLTRRAGSSHIPTLPPGLDGGIDVNKLMELADVALEEEEEERELQ